MGALTSSLMQVQNLVNAVAGITGTVKSITGDVGTLTGANNADDARNLRKEQQLALKQLQQKQSAQIRDLDEQAALDRAKISADSAAQEQQRLAALRRAVARQRAQFGGSGLSSADAGSAQAVLLGLFDESDEDRSARERLDNIRTAALDQNIAAQQRVNVLQLNQLKERQKFEREMLGY